MKIQQKKFSKQWLYLKVDHFDTALQLHWHSAALQFNDPPGIYATLRNEYWKLKDYANLTAGEIMIMEVNDDTLSPRCSFWNNKNKTAIVQDFDDVK